MFGLLVEMVGKLFQDEQLLVNGFNKKKYNNVFFFFKGSIRGFLNVQNIHAT